MSLGSKIRLETSITFLKLISVKIFIDIKFLFQLVFNSIVFRTNLSLSRLPFRIIVFKFTSKSSPVLLLSVLIANVLV